VNAFVSGDLVGRFPQLPAGVFCLGDGSGVILHKVGLRFGGEPLPGLIRGLDPGLLSGDCSSLVVYDGHIEAVVIENALHWLLLERLLRAHLLSHVAYFVLVGFPLILGESELPPDLNLLFNEVLGLGKGIHKLLLLFSLQLSGPMLLQHIDLLQELFFVVYFHLLFHQLLPQVFFFFVQAQKH